MSRDSGDIRQIAVPMYTDDKGYLGRECPECERYFKITPGTGITEGHPPLHCPYCNHASDISDFWTEAQREYALSYAGNQLWGDILKMAKKALEFESKPHKGFGFGLSVKVEGRPAPIHHYTEEALETEVECDACRLRYAVYGVFAFCPDCGKHNSLQMLDKNLDLAEKKLALAASLDTEISEAIITDSLGNVVSALDGFGRETCQVCTPPPAKTASVSFQNLAGARDRVLKAFGIDLSGVVEADEWAYAVNCFQKRHLIAHKMGVIDEDYIARSGDPDAILGRRVMINADEVWRLIEIVRRLARGFVTAASCGDSVERGSEP
mgnify:CR=1 FL=1